MTYNLFRSNQLLAWLGHHVRPKWQTRTLKKTVIVVKSQLFKFNDTIASPDGIKIKQKTTTKPARLLKAVLNFHKFN